MDSETFRKLGHELVDWVADYRGRFETLPVMSRTRPGEIRSRLPVSPPAEGGRIRDAIDALDEVVLPGITHWNHPSFFAYFPSNTSHASILADLVCAGLGAQGMSWQTSPAATEVEEVVMDWLRQMVGLPAIFTGVIHDTASTSTLTALLCARERTSNFPQNREGMQGGEAPMVVYASDQAHSSIEKDALLAGFGKRYLRLVATDRAHAMRIDALAEAVEADRAAGLRPCAVVATTGTTGTTALDPVAGIADVPVVREVRGLGLMLAIELRTKVAPVLKSLMLEHRVIALPAGPTVLRLLPPLVISEDDIAIGVRAIISVLKEASAAPARRPASATS